MDDEDWEEEALGDRTEGDATILQNLGGERQWRFFRPDPFQLGRSTTFQCHVQAHHTLQDVELQIVQHWPDLRNPAARRRLQIVHGSVDSSVYLEAGHEAFIVEVNRDLQVGQVPIMFEYQYWDVTQNRFYGILEPRVHSPLMRGISLMFRDVAGHECHARPCFSNLNGSPLEAFEEYTIQSGDYNVVSGISTSRETIRILGFWSPYANLNEIPLTQAFSRSVGQTMMTDLISFEKGQANAALLQRNMVKVYHDLQRTTNVAQLRPGTILMIAPADGYDPQEVHTVRMTEVQWGTRRSFEFPLLIEALVEANMIEHSWDGSCAEPHHTVYVLTLPVTLNPLDQVMLIRPPHEVVQEVALLAEFRVEGTPQEQERYGHFEIVMVFVSTPTTMNGLLQGLHLERECAEHDGLLHVADGDVVRVWYSVPQSIEENTGSTSLTHHENQESDRSETIELHAPNASTSERPPPQYLPGTLHHCLFYVSWLWKMLGKIVIHKTAWRNRKHGRRRSTIESSCSLAKMNPMRSMWPSTNRVIMIAILMSMFHLGGAIRFGEALHPGPRFWIGTVNPSGMAGSLLSFLRAHGGSLKLTSLE